MKAALLLNFLNLAMCFWWGLLVFKRLAVMTHGVHIRLQVIYVAMFVASPFCALQFFIFGTSAGVTDLIYSAALIAALHADAKRWRNVPPTEAICNVYNRI